MHDSLGLQSGAGNDRSFHETASAEETCNHLINVWIARQGCPVTFQSDNGKAFVGDLTKELMKRSQVA